MCDTSNLRRTIGAALTWEKAKYLRAFNSLRDWLSEDLAMAGRDAGYSATTARKSGRSRLIFACALIFVIASGVRLLHRQDSYLRGGLESLTRRYLNQAEEMLEGKGILYPSDQNEVPNNQLLVHPPGYSAFVAAVFGLFGNSNNAIITAQIIADGAAAVMVTLIAMELLPFTVGVVGGLLIAFSPHLASYCLFISPDSLCVLPILIATYFVSRSVKRPQLVTVVAAGFFLGLSCWLRSNSLLLGLFAALVILRLFEPGKRLRYALVLIAAVTITISPITIRNAVLFHHFIPLSLGAGITMVEGIGDYDREARFGMPVSDHDTKLKDIEWHNRPDYRYSLWNPDGVERDQYRFRRGLDVIRANPLWFGGVMIRRASFMLRYNSAVSQPWPVDTARVPEVASEPSFSHHLELPPATETVWTNSAEELKAKGRQLVPEAETSLSADARTLEVAGDASEFGDQIASPPIAVERNTDYILRFRARLLRGGFAAKVTSADRQFSLSHATIEEPERKSTRTARRGDDSTGEVTDNAPVVIGEGESMPVFDVPFASGDRSEVLLVFSNNGASSARPAAQIGGAELFRVGPTAQVWTRTVRPTVRSIQRNLYTTSRMLPLIIAGIVLLGIARRKNVLLVLLVVPAYYLCVQSAFHTEYRYILAIHYFLFIMAAVTVYFAGKLIGLGVHRVAATLKH